MMKRMVLVVLMALFGGALLLFFGSRFSKGKFVSLPEQIEFYKGVSLSVNAPESELEEAKNLGANIVGFGVTIVPRDDGTWGLSDSPPEGGKSWQQIMSTQVERAHKKGLHVALSLVFYPEQLTREPQVWLDHAKPLYQEVGEFANKHDVYLVTVPGEIEAVTGATCCSLDPSADLITTANNELSAKGFAFWSSKISHELKDELRKSFDGHVAAAYIAGNWWFEGERLVGLPPWDMEGFYAIVSGIQFDDPAFVDDVAGVSQRRAEVLREVARRSKVDKVIFGVPPINAIRSYTRGGGFSLDAAERRALYELFFQKTHALLSGYSLPRFPPPHYDPVAFAVAEGWYARLPEAED